MVAPTLSDYEYQFKDNGFKLNSDVVLPFVDVHKVTGLDAPEYRLTENEFEGLDGGYIDAEYLKVRTIIIEGSLYADVTSVEATLDTLKTNFGPLKKSEPLYFKHPGVDQRLVFCKPIACRYDVDTLRRLGQSPIQLQLKAADPRTYASVLTTQGTVPTSVAGGIGFPVTFPVSFGSSGTSGTIGAYNYGNHPAPAVLTIVGPVSDPSIEHVESGKILSFDIDVAVNDTLVVDLGNRTVLLNGTANRRNVMIPSSRWFLLEPGTNTLRFNGIYTTTVADIYDDGYSDIYGNSSPPRLDASYRSAWR